MGDVIESIISEAYKAYDTPPKTGSAKEQTGPTKMTHLQQHVLAYEKMMRLNECVIMIMHNCTWARQLFAH